MASRTVSSGPGYVRVARHQPAPQQVRALPYTDTRRTRHILRRRRAVIEHGVTVASTNKVDTVLLPGNPHRLRQPRRPTAQLAIAPGSWPGFAHAFYPRYRLERADQDAGTDTRI